MFRHLGKAISPHILFYFESPGSEKREIIDAEILMLRCKVLKKITTDPVHIKFMNRAWKFYKEPKISDHCINGGTFLFFFLFLLSGYCFSLNWALHRYTSPQWGIKVINLENPHLYKINYWLTSTVVINLPYILITPNEWNLFFLPVLFFLFFFKLHFHF